MLKFFKQCLPTAILCFPLLSAVDAGAESSPLVSLEPLAPTPPGPEPEIDAIAEEATAARIAPAQSAEETLLQPFTVSPRSHAGSLLVKSVAGYDQAADEFVSRSVAEARLWRMLTLRMEFEHGPGMGPDNRLGAGVRAEVLNSSRHGIDLGLGAFYQPNDFREEGQVVGALFVGRYFGRFALYANALVGGDPEGDDAALEARLAALFRVSHSLRLGWDNRGRFNMSKDEKRQGTTLHNWELQSLSTLSYTIGPVALLAEAGVSALSVTGPFGTLDEESSTDSGLLALAGAGGAF